MKFPDDHAQLFPVVPWDMVRLSLVTDAKVYSIQFCAFWVIFPVVAASEHPLNPKVLFIKQTFPDPNGLMNRSTFAASALAAKAAVIPKIAIPVVRLMDWPRSGEDQRRTL